MLGDEGMEQVVLGEVGYGKDSKTSFFLTL
jgi:hypothetical protein